MGIDITISGLPGGSLVKNSSVNAGDSGNVGLIPGLEKSSGEGNGTPLWYSCLKNFMERVAWWAMVLRITKSQT